MNKPTLSSPASRRRWLTWLIGVVVADVATGLLYVGITLLLFSVSKHGAFQQAVVIFGLPSFILIPLFGGFLASYCWRRLNPGIGATALGVLGMTLPGLAGAAVFLGEGLICLLIVCPLFYVVVFTGALLGRIWFKSDPTRLRLCILPLLVLFAAGEPLTRADRTSVVTDEMLIHASADKVWAKVTAFPAIQAPPRYWMFRIGLPYPVETTSDGDFAGADRRCIFSDGMVFGEKVVEWVPRENLTFDITELPQHPELIGHITPHRGQFLLRDNGDGTTTLTGSTWYTLHVRPLWYFDWWTEQIFRAVHFRVMEDIRRRAESERSEGASSGRTHLNFLTETHRLAQRPQSTPSWKR